MGGLLLRFGISLIAVLALVLAIAQVLNGRARRTSRVVTLLARAQLTKGSAIAVVMVADRTLVLGATDHQVTLLAETDSDLVAEPPPIAGRWLGRGRGRKHPRHAPGSPRPDLPVEEIIPDFTAHLEAEADSGHNQQFDQAMDGALEVALTEVIQAARTTTPETPVAPETPKKSRKLRKPKKPRNTAESGWRSGSVLSGTTWRRAVEALRERTVRK